MNSYKTTISVKFKGNEPVQKEFTITGKKGWTSMCRALQQFRKEGYPKGTDVETITINSVSVGRATVEAKPSEQPSVAN